MVDEDLPLRRAGHDLQANVFAQQACKHLLCGPKIVVHAERLGLDELAPRERQQLPREIRRALGGLCDLLETGTRGVVLGQRRLRHLGAAENHREQIVEVVGHTARKARHRFHLLRLEQALLRGLATRHFRAQRFVRLGQLSSLPFEFALPTECEIEALAQGQTHAVEHDAHDRKRDDGRCHATEGKVGGLLRA